jgi:hypothetical protein
MLTLKCSGILTSKELRRGGDNVKNALRVFVLALVTVAFSGISFAQEKKPAPETPAPPAMEKKAERAMEKAPEEKATKKAKTKQTKKSTAKSKAKTEGKKAETTEKSTK